MESQNITPREPQDEHIIENKELNIWEALIPVFALIGMLFYNVFFVYGDDALSGSNQFILLMGAAVAAIVGFFNKVSYKQMMEEVAENVKSTTGALLILLMVGALAGTWLISGIIPSMIYYGLQMLNPTIFLAASVNVISTLLKIGVRNLLAAELLASSLVADLHLIPAFIVLTFYNNTEMAIALAIGAIVANIFSVALGLIESAKMQHESEK